MADSHDDRMDFDDAGELALAQAAGSAAPRPEVKARLLETIAATPRGFAFSFSAEGEWQPHPVPGIRMRVLSVNREARYATLLLDVRPGTRFPAHHHAGAEECFVVSGSLTTCGRHLRAGDFVHADAGTDHGELATDAGCRVILVVGLDDFLSDAAV